MMFLTDLCRAREIGANCLFLEIGPFRIIVDAGLHPKYAGWQATPFFDNIPFDSIDFILLTHCHLDHLGALPVIAERQPSATILASIPSHLLLGRLLGNSYNVMMRQKEELSITEYPLYPLNAIGVLERRVLNMAYGKPRIFKDKKNNLEITFFEAGHVVGAAGIQIKYNGKSLFLTGDVLFEKQYTLPGAHFPETSHDVLILETTRGASVRTKSRSEEVERLIQTIATTLARGGSCLIPAFALGRMQEVIAILHHAYAADRLPKVPIFCSGLGMALVEYFDYISRRTGLCQFRDTLIKDLNIRMLKDALTPGKPLKKSAIYILSSGMLVENTPSYTTAAALAGDERHSLCFVGYCDPETPGGALLNAKLGEPFTFGVLDYTTPLKAHVERFDLSGHADREELVAFAKKINPKTLILTHGEAEARDWFLKTLPTVLPQTHIVDPMPGERYDLLKNLTI